MCVEGQGSKAKLVTDFTHSQEFADDGEPAVSQTRPFVLLIDALQCEPSTTKPESLCGASSVIASFMRCLSAAADVGVGVLVLVPSHYAHLSLERAREQYPGFGFVTAAELVERYRTSRVVLQCMGHGIDRAAALRQRAGRIDWPIIGMTHDLFDRTISQSLANYALWNAPRADTVICASVFARRILQHYCSCIEQTPGIELDVRLPVIPHGVDSRPIKRWSGRKAKENLYVSGRTVFLYFGRISIWQKADLIGLVRCFNERFANQDATLIIAGGAIQADVNPELTLLRQTIAAFGAEGEARIQVLPNVSEEMKNILFSAADVFVSPANSLQETFGLAIVEAMLYQLPVVATRWSGYAEIVLDGVTGYLIGMSIESHDKLEAATFLDEPERSVSAVQAVTIDWTEFGTRMQTLARDRRLRLRLARTGLERAHERFLIADMVRAYAAEWKAQGNDQSAPSSIDRQWRGPRIEVLASIALGYSPTPDIQPHRAELQP